MMSRTVSATARSLRARGGCISCRAMTDFWAGRRVLADRAHRLQGRLARAVAARARRGGDRLRRRRRPPSRPCSSSPGSASCVDGPARRRPRPGRRRGGRRGAPGPEVVLHLAAQPLVRRAWREPVEAFAVNALGTAHVLEAVRAHAPRAPPSSSSPRDKVLRRPRQRPPLPRGRPARRQGPLLRLEGRGGARRRRLPRLLRPAGRDRPRRQRDRRRRLGRGPDPPRRRPRRPGRPRRSWSATRRAVRPWQHVLNPLSGYLLLAERLAGLGGATRRRWNFAPPLEHEQRPGRLARRALRRRRSAAPLDVARRAPRRPARGGPARARPDARRRAPRLARALAAGARARDRRLVPARGVRGRGRAGGDAGADARRSVRRRRQRRLGREAREPPRSACPSERDRVDAQR